MTTKMKMTEQEYTTLHKYGATRAMVLDGVTRPQIAAIRENVDAERLRGGKARARARGLPADEKRALDARMGLTATGGGVRLEAGGVRLVLG